MNTGMMIYLLVCGLIGLALVVLALMSLIENWFKQRTKAVVLDACGMFFGLVVVLVAFLAILGMMAKTLVTINALENKSIALAKW